MSAHDPLNARPSPSTFRDLGPSEEWFCRCRDYGGPVLRPASMRVCQKCDAIAPWTRMVNQRG